MEDRRLINTAWGEDYQERFEGPVLASGGDQQTAMERAAQLSVDFLPPVDPALLAIHHRQQELLWTEGLIERIDNELEAAGVLGRPARVPARSFLDLVGYTRLTEERGDQAAAPGVSLVWGSYGSRGLPGRCGCWRPAGQDRAPFHSDVSR